MVQASRKARVSTTIHISEGPMRLRNIEYLVLEDNMDEILLSRLVLQSFGFNLDQNLARVRHVFENAGISDVTWEPDNSFRAQNSLPGGILSKPVREPAPKGEVYFLDK